MKLKNKVAVVTGAGRGLGRATSIAFAEQGAEVVLFDVKGEAIQSAAKEIAQKGGEALSVIGDVSKKNDVKTLFETVMNKYRSLDILMNNAAVIGPPRFIEDADTDAWSRAIGTNLYGVYLCALEAIKIMKERNGGSVINVTSGLARMPFPRFCAYGVTKAGVEQFTRNLAEEFADQNIRINAIDPGVMDTGMQEEIRALGEKKLGKELNERFKAFKARKELVDPAVVARLAIYLASDAAAHFSGRVLSLSDLPAGFLPK